jgi:uncharacterized protein DUF6984
MATMNNSPKQLRPLTQEEKKLFGVLFQENFPGRDELVKQIDNSLVEQLDAHGCLEFHNVSGLPARVKSRIPVEGEFEDLDGVTIHVLVHVVDHRIKSLEIFKNDSSEIIKMPEPKKLRIFSPD